MCLMNNSSHKNENHKTSYGCLLCYFYCIFILFYLTIDHILSVIISSWESLESGVLKHLTTLGSNIFLGIMCTLVKPLCWNKQKQSLKGFPVNRGSKKYARYFKNTREQNSCSCLFFKDFNKIECCFFFIFLKFKNSYFSFFWIKIGMFSKQKFKVLGQMKSLLERWQAMNTLICEK